MDEPQTYSRIVLNESEILAILIQSKIFIEYSVPILIL